MEYKEPNLEPTNYMPATKTEYEGTMETRLRDLGAKIDDLLSKAEVAKEKAQVKADELRAKQEAAMSKLKEMKDCGGEAWREFKPGLDRAWEDLRQAWDELRGASERAAQKFQ